jgi:hypothetical protein
MNDFGQCSCSIIGAIWNFGHSGEKAEEFFSIGNGQKYKTNLPKRVARFN